MRHSLMSLFGIDSKRSAARTRKSQPTRPPLGMELLEGRTLMTATVSFANGTLTITGTGGSAVAQVDNTGPGADGVADTADDVLTVTVEGQDPTEIDPMGKKVKKIVFTGTDGCDKFTNDTAIKSRADGGKGNDTLIGGGGEDVLIGGQNDDEVNGRGGKDTLRGGPEADHFISEDSKKELKDFSPLEGDTLN